MDPIRHTNKSNQCDGKVRFESAALAHQVVSRRRSQGKTGVTYRCPHCGIWRIGTPRKAR